MIYFPSWPWHQITSYADVGVMIPASLVLVIWCLFAKSWRAAFAWAFCFCAGLGITVLSKLAFMGWGLGIQAWDFTGFSGHAMRAAAIFPVALYLIPRPFSTPRAQQIAKFAALLLGILLGILVGYSRIAVGAHSVSEAVMGTVLGAASGLAFVYLVRKQELHVPFWLIVVSVFLFSLTPHRVTTPTQSWLIGVAMQISGHDRPFLRECWCFPADAWIKPGDPDGWRKRPPYPPRTFFPGQAMRPHRNADLDMPNTTTASSPPPSSTSQPPQPPTSTGNNPANGS